jgi:hypothetical protein
MKLSDLIHAVAQTDNVWLRKQLEKLEQEIKNEPNYFVLGEKMKRWIDN